YALDRIAANQLAYATDHHVEASSSVRWLAGAEIEENEVVPVISRRRALLGALRGAVNRAKRLVVRDQTQTPLRSAAKS
ncbi:MAG TPA: hypothetical protein VGX96_21260, partial [Candidatus Elarobacter sp.]|nr:hypothetical protein [Candidatus Elarobacter sp.]